MVVVLSLASYSLPVLHAALILHNPVVLYGLQLLGIQANRAEISELLAEVDSDGSGEVEYPEFIQIMTSTLAKLSERKEQEGSNQVAAHDRYCLSYTQNEPAGSCLTCTHELQADQYALCLSAPHTCFSVLQLSIVLLHASHCACCCRCHSRF